jgi:hypothetical protein
MTIYEIDPLRDPRWPEFLDRTPHASAFHTPAWLNAMHRTYGYEPVAFTTSPGNAQLESAIVFCRVKSWVTGPRLVSLPFSDHCQLLIGKSADLPLILDHLQQRAQSEPCKYIELRPRSGEALSAETAFAESTRFRFHTIDLKPDLDRIFRTFHESCIRRKIRKAEREQLQYEVGRSEELLQKFRSLLLLTRRRHQLPPQPLAWFRNLIDCMGTELDIHLVSKGDDPVASIVTLSYKKSLIYKYGVSDARFNNLGGTPLLFWKAIQKGKQMGAEEFDLGRSGLEDEGLSDFKAHLGGIASELKYFRYSKSRAKVPALQSKPSLARRVFARLPEPIFAGAGRLVYKHLG